MSQKVLLKKTTTSKKQKSSWKNYLCCCILNQRTYTQESDKITLAEQQKNGSLSFDEMNKKIACFEQDNSFIQQQNENKKSQLRQSGIERQQIDTKSFQSINSQDQVVRVAHKNSHINSDQNNTNNQNNLQQNLQQPIETSQQKNNQNQDIRKISNKTNKRNTLTKNLTESYCSNYFKQFNVNQHTVFQGYDPNNQIFGVFTEKKFQTNSQNNKTSGFDVQEIFSSSNQGIKFDFDSTVNVAPQIVSSYIAKKCKNTSFIIDAFCGVGAYSIQFSQYADFVLGIDSNLQKIQFAKNNAEVLGATQKLDFLQEDFLKTSKFKGDLTFFAPTFLDSDNGRGDLVNGCFPSFKQSVQMAYQQSKNMMILLNKRADIQQGIDIMCEVFSQEKKINSYSIELEAIYINNKIEFYLINYGFTNSITQKDEITYIKKQLCQNIGGDKVEKGFNDLLSYISDKIGNKYLFNHLFEAQKSENNIQKCFIDLILQDPSQIVNYYMIQVYLDPKTVNSFQNSAKYDRPSNDDFKLTEDFTYEDVSSLQNRLRLKTTDSKNNLQYLQKQLKSDSNENENQTGTKSTELQNKNVSLMHFNHPVNVKNALISPNHSQPQQQVDNNLNKKQKNKVFFKEVKFSDQKGSSKDKEIILQQYSSSPFNKDSAGKFNFENISQEIIVSQSFEDVDFQFSEGHSLTPKTFTLNIDGTDEYNINANTSICLSDNVDRNDQQQNSSLDDNIQSKTYKN